MSIDYYEESLLLKEQVRQLNQKIQSQRETLLAVASLITPWRMKADATRPNYQESWFQYSKCANELEHVLKQSLLAQELTQHTHEYIETTINGDAHRTLRCTLCSAVKVLNFDHQKKWLQFNINREIQFKPTEYGIQHYRKKREEMNRLIKTIQLPTELETNAQGYAVMQMHEFMSYFGDVAFVGGDNFVEECLIQLPIEHLEMVEVY